MINNLLRENCSHCLKGVYIGQPSFECYECNCITHSKCFSRSNAEIINCNYFCSSCKDEIAQRYNPFKNFDSSDDLPDPNDDIARISSILENCQPYTASELLATHNLKILTIFLAHIFLT